MDLSKKLFPDDPLTLIHGDNLPGFDGALLPAPSGQKGWGILYNSSIRSRGRINFTLAHEFGHYLIHRLVYPNGMRCSQQDVVRWDAEYKQVEQEANTFASYLLMPLDDFRRQLDPRTIATFDHLSHCAEHYEVSLVAATLRWLLYTERRAVLVVSRDGYVLWARSSQPAFKSGAYIRTSGPPVPLHEASVAAHPDAYPDARLGVNLPAGVWFPEPCQEMSLISESYDFTLSLIQLAPGGSSNRYFESEDEDATEDLGEQIRRNHGL